MTIVTHWFPLVPIGSPGPDRQFLVFLNDLLLSSMLAQALSHHYQIISSLGGLSAPFPSDPLGQVLFELVGKISIQPGSAQKHQKGRVASIGGTCTTILIIYTVPICTYIQLSKSYLMHIDKYMRDYMIYLPPQNKKETEIMNHV